MSLPDSPFNAAKVISFRISLGEYYSFIDRIVHLAQQRFSSYVCVANVHMCIEAQQHSDFRDIVNNADLVTPDGMPLVFALKLLYGLKQQRVAGMDLLPDLLTIATQKKLKLFF